jgi:antitoxin (DNA-binding transcriptional repressor) of toxin-antitoxin stability system
MTAEPHPDAYNIHEAKTNLSRIIDRVEHGEEIIISRAGTPSPRSSRSTHAPNAPAEVHSPGGSASPTTGTPHPSTTRSPATSSSPRE